MDVNILGPLEIRGREGREIKLPAGRERSLLVLLLIHRGEVVSTDRIVDALWGHHPPETATKAVQGYVSHLRRVLEPEHESGEAAVSSSRSRPAMHCARTRSRSMRCASSDSSPTAGARSTTDSAAEAAEVLDEALGLWRGPALAEFAFDDFARDEIDRLEELRLVCDRGQVRVAPPSRPPRRDRRPARLAGRRSPAARAPPGPVDAGPVPQREAGGRAPGLPRRTPAARERARAGARPGAPASRAHDPRPGSRARGSAAAPAASASSAARDEQPPPRSHLAHAAARRRGRRVPGCRACSAGVRSRGAR